MNGLNSHGGVAAESETERIFLCRTSHLLKVKLNVSSSVGPHICFNQKNHAEDATHFITDGYSDGVFNGHSHGGKPLFSGFLAATFAE